MIFYCTSLLVGAIFRCAQWHNFFGFNITATGAETLADANPGLLVQNKGSIIIRLLCLRAMQWMMQVARFPLLAYSIRGLKHGPHSIYSLSLVMVFLICSVTLYSLASDLLVNNEAGRLTNYQDSAEEQDRVSFVMGLMKFCREKDTLVQLGAALAVTLTDSPGVLLVVPVLFVMRNVLEMASSNRRVGLFHLLVVLRSVLQVTFVSFLLFNRHKIVAFILGIIYCGFYMGESAFLQYSDYTVIEVAPVQEEQAPVRN
jgi:hypothetical protein